MSADIIFSMDYKDILKILTNSNPNPDKTSLISALASGGDMAALLPFLMNRDGKGDPGKVFAQSDGKEIELPSEDEIKQALLRLNGENDDNA